jgi:hypothetical protein
MRRRLRLFGIVVLICLYAGAVGAQEIVEKIPQRVFFTMHGEIPPIEERKTIASLPEIYYTTISSQQPIIRVEKAEEAHSVVEIGAEPLPGGGVSLSVFLLQEEGPIYSDDFPYTGNIDTLLRFVDDSSRDMSGYLGLVEPEVIVAEEVEDTELRQMVQKIDFADQTAKPFEVTLWLSGLSRNFTNYMFPIDRFSVFPIALEGAWFLSRNSGVKVAFMFDYMDIVSDIDLDTEPNFFIFPGIGFQYRTLGRIAAGFGITQYFGGVFVNSGFSFIPLTTFEPSIGVNILPWMAVRFKFSFGFNTGIIFGMMDTLGIYNYGVVFTIAALGITVRF